MTIPLFRLPILVIKLILETMRFTEIFVLTSASSKTKRYVKNLVKVKNHEMFIIMEKGELLFQFQNISNPDFWEQIYSEWGNSHPKSVFFLKIGTIDRVPSEFLPAEDRAAVLMINWNENIKHGSVLCNALFELFKLPVKYIKMDLTGVEVKTQRGWINLFNETLSTASFLEIVGECNYSDYVWISDNVKTENGLTFNITL